MKFILYKEELQDDVTHIQVTPTFIIINLLFSDRWQNGVVNMVDDSD